MGRAPCCDKANVKRGPWSPEEDATLKNYLHKHGTAGNWISLPQRAGLKRCGKSCRLRWLNYLRPDIKHGAFSDEEDNIIISLYYKMGSRWSVIAANLPGRTDNDVKNHWNTKLKKKLFGGSSNNFNNPSKIDVPFTYTNILEPHHPSSSSTPTPSTSPSLSPTPTYVDNTTNHNHNQFYVPFPSFSTLLSQTQCSGSTTTINSSMSLLSDFTMENSLLSPYPLNQQPITVTESIEEASSASSVVYGSNLDDDPFFSELGFGSIQQGSFDDQQDIKPQGLTWSKCG